MSIEKSSGIGQGHQSTIEGKTLMDEFETNVKRIARIYGKDKICVGFSGGDDSAFLVDKVVEIFGNETCIVFCDSRIQFKETHDYIKKMIEYWNLTNFHKTYPKKNEVFPVIAKRIGLHGIAKNKMICCSALKNDPLGFWMKDNGKTVSMTGIRLKEAKKNRCYDIISYNNRRDIYYASPMYFLNEIDVKNHFKETGLPKNPLYLEPYCANRTGCALCPLPLKIQRYNSKYKTYYDWLKEHFPRWYKYAWRCQKSFYENKCKGGNQRGYGDMIYRHKWEWSLDVDLNSANPQQVLKVQE